MAGAVGVDPATLALAMRENDPWNSLDFTDVAEKRGGLVGAASAGGTSATADAAPSIPAMETSAQTLAPTTPIQQSTTPLRIAAGDAMKSPLAKMFKVKPVGNAAALAADAETGQALPLTRRA